MERFDCIVIGAGVVGLACARALARRGREVVILEAAARFGSGISSRSSEVIHAGLYYPAGSLKAQLCARGRQQLYDYCAQRHIPHRRCGKLLIACSAAQIGGLAAIADQARSNGVDDLQELSLPQVRRLEPQLRCSAAQWSPSTGIVDCHALMLSLLGDAERHGATLVTNTAVVAGQCSPVGEHRLTIAETDRATRHHIATSLIVNAVGLAAVNLARRFAGVDNAFIPAQHFAKGNYFSLSGKAPFSRLIYPLPEPGGLSIHLTLDLNGSARFGPDVEWLAPASDRDTPSLLDYYSPQHYRVSSARRDSFIDAIRAYWPALPCERLQAGYAGIRPKLHCRHEAAADFRIDGQAVHGIPGLINLFGIESPGLTAALAIGDHVAALCERGE